MTSSVAHQPIEIEDYARTTRAADRFRSVRGTARRRPARRARPAGPLGRQRPSATRSGRASRLGTAPGEPDVLAAVWPPLSSGPGGADHASRAAPACSSAGRRSARWPSDNSRRAWKRPSIRRPASPRRSITLFPASTPLVLPRAIGIALELEHQLRPGLEAQVSVRQRLGSSLPTVEVPAAGGIMPLTHSGTSMYRELQVSIHQTWRDDRQLFLSYVWSASRADVNDFGTLFVNLDAPLLEPAGRAPTSTDVPHRLRGWSTFGTAQEHRRSRRRSIGGRDSPTRSRTSTGTMSASRTASASPITSPSTSPSTRRSTSRAHKADLGLQFFNVTSHFNPRDVISVDRIVAVRHLHEQLRIDARRLHAGQVAVVRASTPTVRRSREVFTASDRRSA